MLVGKKYQKDGPAGSWVNEGDDVMMSLYGFVSASLSREFAEKNAYSEK